MRKPIVVITLGDPGGIGPEVTVKALSRLRREPVFRAATLIWIGIPSLFESLARTLRAGIPYVTLPLVHERYFRRERVHFLDVATGILPFESERLRIVPTEFEAGRVSEKNAFLAESSLRIAAYLASCGIVQAVVTSPVHKQAMRLLKRDFVGHTEYLAQLSHSKKVAMMFDAGSFRVTLATTHLPLNRVASALTPSLIRDKIVLTADFLRKRYRIRKPKVAVLALNPHGSEFGTEETRIILPAIGQARRRRLSVTGPHPADGFFLERAESRYDAVIAMYHDQGLIPVKRLAGGQAVNVTLGLPYVRTSPDHGTAFEIAGRFKADESSMLRAIRLAIQLARTNRN